MGRWELISSLNILGHGVFAGNRIEEDEYLAKYKGEVINLEECKRRIDNNMGAYVFYLTDRNGNEYCIDALLSHSICKFVNDSPKEFANAEMEIVDGRDGEPPMLALYSSKVINKG